MVGGNPTAVGSCLCRGVTYQVSGSLGRMWHCHSVVCRKLGGAAFATHVEARATDFNLLQGQEFITDYEVSSGHERSFCRTCGSVVPFATRDGSRVVLPAGGLDDDLSVDPTVRPFAHAFVAESATWHTITDDLPQFATSLPDDATCPPQPVTLQSRESGEAPGQGSCLCGGIAFEVRGELGAIKNCHCWRDRKATGSPHDSCLLAEAYSLRWVQGEALLVVFRLPEEPGFRTGFCRVCGSNLPAFVKEEMSLCVPAGSLDGDPAIQARYHIFCGGKASWFEITDDLPQFALYPPPGFDWRQSRETGRGRGPTP